MTRYALVGCGKQKHEIDGHPNHSQNQYAAAALYTSTYFRMKREYAERMCDYWTILSAKHGCLSAFCWATPYDVRLTASGFDGDDDPEFESIDEWAADVLESAESTAHYHANHDAHEPLEEVVVLAGQNYINPIRDGLAEIAAEWDFEVVYPFADTTGFGDQMAWLKEHTDPEAPVSETYASIMQDDLGEDPMPVE